MELSAMRDAVDINEAQRAHVPGDEEHPQDEGGVTDAVDDKGLSGRVTGGLALKVETDQQIRAEAHALPSDEQQHIVVRQNQREHGEHEEVEIAEEAVVATLVRHVSGGINMDQHAHAS